MLALIVDTNDRVGAAHLVNWGLVNFGLWDLDGFLSCHGLSLPLLGDFLPLGFTLVAFTSHGDLPMKKAGLSTPPFSKYWIIVIVSRGGCDACPRRLACPGSWLPCGNPGSGELWRNDRDFPLRPVRDPGGGGRRDMPAQ